VVARLRLARSAYSPGPRPPTEPGRQLPRAEASDRPRTTRTKEPSHSNSEYAPRARRSLAETTFPVMEDQIDPDEREQRARQTGEAGRKAPARGSDATRSARYTHEHNQIDPLEREQTRTTNRRDRRLSVSAQKKSRSIHARLDPSQTTSTPALNPPEIRTCSLRIATKKTSRALPGTRGRRR
jgi:hypothetical protein